MRIIAPFLFFIFIFGFPKMINAQLAGAYNVYYFRFNLDPSYYSDGNFTGIPYEGSPWFNTSFIPARITLFDGETIEGNQFKLNLYNNKLFTENEKQQLIVLTSAIKRIEFLNEGKKAAVFQAGFPRVDKQRWNSFYQVLAEGNAKLLKYIHYTFSDRMQYGQGVTFKLEPQFYFYVFANNQMHPIKKVDDLALLFPDWINEVKGYIIREGLKIKKETDLIKIVSFYNSLALLNKKEQRP
ncbi:MAG: hypothetical protein B7Y11_07275 [Sphingobacteriia bacterium 24-36-13]|jgi:hypothetical protein|uniref:hypothetical protein n=1 Tax=Sediminibacterium sp. TaxID=1917865 RepID=UPI000BD69798|nr:hypothetical protein [Sediminibacterium sp.]OYY09895.1 MAG: hypothetical protein B7Y66_07390 [Sphingobacteriia bacterium 35-36-14]OYZ54077.1 MAG: hypothetical protein B7Y11_07275 [Sphingobacteriia bacterium 24-36-13]OZA65293.1 MAG: hypothetical protein B7X68_04260 [Sphingobacteriia bacterium 39-36-14]HQS24222.1 hypothetical protein [Sediminibacterium sp.]